MKSNIDANRGLNAVKIVMDESNMDLTWLLGTLRAVAPDVWGSSDRRYILPQKMEDLEKPECLKEIKDKIQRLASLKEMIDAGSISQEEYGFKKNEILSKN
ncbi:Uncharacterised protein [uncultured archaeon]|nr:Uncharacterised protein [uncultured archaeon]